MKPLGPTDPQRVGQYRLLGKLGAGGMGSVYLARSDRGRTVAVKLVQPELARQPEFRQRFKQEVEAARRIGGEFTAPVLGGDTEAETPWVATGYVAGPSLHEVVVSTYGNLPERTLRILGNGLVRALRDIHAAGLVHRDLKPSNVLITIDGPRVIDFGIARALETNEGLTRTGAAVGSPGFMSPEQCRGETVTAASDIFCLGSVLTFAATGRTPFGDHNSPMTALMLAIVQDEKDITGVPEGIRGLVESCLAQNPANRPTLDQLLRWTEPRAEEADGADEREPWLPGALIATLGRHAIELLDSEDPLHAPPMPTMQPPPAMPSAPPPVTPLPPSAPPPMAPPVTPPPVTPPPVTPPPSPPPGMAPGMAPHQTPTQFAPSTPPPSPAPTPAPPPQTMTSATPPPSVARGGYGYPAATPPPASGGYGYPAATPPPASGGYGYPQPAPTPYGHTTPPPAVNTPYGMGAVPPPGTGGPGGPGGRHGGGQNKKMVWLIVAAAVVAVALIVGITVVALGGDSEEEAGSGGESQQPTQDPTDEPTQDPTQEPTEDPTTDPAASVPAEMVGAWEGEITDTSGTDQGIFRRMEISEGSAGATVATTWNVYPDVMCLGSGDLVSGDASQVTITSEISRTVPSDQACTAYGEQTLELQSDGTLLWTNPDDGLQAVLEAATGAGEDAMPGDHLGTFSGTTPDGTRLDIETETVAAAGELGITYTSDTCTWEAEMVSGTVDGERALYGPGEVTSGSCEPLPAYRVTAVVNDETFLDDLDFQRLDGTTPDFTAEYESLF